MKKPEKVIHSNSEMKRVNVMNGKDMFSKMSPKTTGESIKMKGFEKPKECKHEWKPSIIHENRKVCLKCGVSRPVESRDEGKTIEEWIAQGEKSRAGESVPGLNDTFVKVHKKILSLEQKLDRWSEIIEDMRVNILENGQRLDELEKFNDTRFRVQMVDMNQLEKRLEKLESANRIPKEVIEKLNTKKHGIKKM